jgi:DNA-binding transcriptional MerR regulator
MRSAMPLYRLIEDAARNLNTTVATLHELEERGWITVAERNGYRYLAGNQEYKARFVLDLRNRRKLNVLQIDKVLREQKPPYSMPDVDRILAGG